MADAITAKDESSQFSPHPEGSWPAIIVDTIALGERLEVFPGRAPRAVQKVALVFATGELNEAKQLHIIAREFTNSLFETASLRKFLGQLRGKQLSEQQARAGLELSKLVGVGGYIVVEHKTSQKGRVYALISNVTPLPQGIKAPVLPVPYERAEFWVERKKAYADELAAVSRSAKTSGAAGGGDGGGEFNDYPEALKDEDDELPF